LTPTEIDLDGPVARFFATDEAPIPRFDQRDPSGSTNHEATTRTCARRSDIAVGTIVLAADVSSLSWLVRRF
jgi:hypothetical protein